MISVVDYDPAWADRFEVLRDAYSVALAASDVPFTAIEHVGSTAVVGLAAKPIIDVDVVVPYDSVLAASDVLVVPRGERGIPLRWAFWEPPRLRDTNAYVVVDGSLALRNHLAVRDLLRADEALRNEYAEVKHRVAATAADIFDYGRGKNAVLQKILQAAGLSTKERASIGANQVPTVYEVPRPIDT